MAATRAASTIANHNEAMRAATVTPNKSIDRNTEAFDYYAFVLLNGKVRSFNTRTAALEFKEEYGDIIKDEEAFRTEGRMIAYIQRRGTVDTVTTTDTTITHVKDMSDSDKKKFNSLITMREANKPSNSFVHHWTTSRKSKYVVVLIRPEDQKGNDLWYWKSPMDEVLKWYFKQNPTDQAAVNEYFQNVELVDMRDKEGSNTTVKATKSKSSDRLFQQKVMKTRFELPVAQLTSAEEEQEYIETTLQFAVTSMRDAQRETLFMKLLENCYSEKMYEVMMRGNVYTGNLQDFFQRAKVRTKRCENLNTHIVQKEVDEVKMFLYETEVEFKKYPSDYLYKDQKERMQQKKDIALKMQSIKQENTDDNMKRSAVDLNKKETKPTTPRKRKGSTPKTTPDKKKITTKNTSQNKRKKTKTPPKRTNTVARTEQKVTRNM